MRFLEGFPALVLHRPITNRKTGPKPNTWAEKARMHVKPTGIWFAQLTIDKTIQHFKFQETLLEAVFMVVKAVSNVSLCEWTLATVSSIGLSSLCVHHIENYSLTKVITGLMCIPDILMGSSALFLSSPLDPESPETGLALVSIAWTKALSNIFWLEPSNSCILYH